MRYYFNIIIFLLSSVILMAVPATPDTLRMIQPDGSTVELMLNGDEHFHYLTNMQGGWVRLDADGFYVPTEALSDDDISQRIQMSPIRKMRQRLAARRHFPTKGQQKSLVILVQFEDLSFTTANPQNAFHTMLNQKGYSENGATGSARDYYLASSNGQFNPAFVTVGPYTLPHETAYYGGNTSQGSDRPARLMQFCRDAVAAASTDVDFSEYDTDNDGYIDNVFIYYAGYSESEGGNEYCIWPHQYGVVPDSVIGTCSFNGKTISSYACTSELKGNTGSVMSGIGTFCHEFGHVLGLPDYYHTSKKGVTTLGRWDIMDSGSYLNNGNTPPTHSAFNRFCLGWLSPVQINQAATLNLYTLAQDTFLSNTTQAYLIAEGVHNMEFEKSDYPEYFIVEYRKQIGWDTYMPDSGMIIWHIDYDKTAWDDNTVNNINDSVNTPTSHLRVYIENPNGNTSVSKPAAFHEGDEFYPVLWSGSQLGQNITSIKEMSEYCTFDFMGGGIDKTAPVAIEPEVVSYNSMRAAWHPLTTDDQYDVSYLFTAFTLAGGDTAYIVRRELVTDTTYMLSGLKEETIYTYFVSAYLQSENEAVETFRSNIIKAATTVEKSLKRMSVYVVGNGGSALIFINKPSASDDLYIYDETSRLLSKVNTGENLECVSADHLPVGHTYIFRAGAKYAKVAL